MFSERKWGYLILFLIFGAAAVFFFIGFTGENEEYARAEKVYGKPATVAVQGGENAGGKASEEAPDELYDWAGMREAYPDLVGWIEGKDISYPLVQGEDNDYYLKHLADKTDNRLGSIFIDKDCRGDFGSDVTIIYGHMTSDGSMFAPLKGYREQEFWEENPVIHIYSPKGNKEIHVMASYLVDARIGSYPINFESSADKTAFVDIVLKRSFIKTGVMPKAGDRLAILSTCAYDFNDARLAVVGVLR